MTWRVRMPQLGVNDLGATLHREKEEGEYVERGEIIALAETSKATFEIVAEEGGYIAWSTGDEFMAGEAIATIHDDQERGEPLQEEEITTPEKVEDNRIISRGAIREAELAGITIAEIPYVVISKDTVRDWGNRHMRIAIYGAGAGGLGVLRILDERPGSEEIACFLDDYKRGTIDGLDVFRPDDMPGDVKHLIVALSNSEAREKAIEWGEEEDLELINVIHPNTNISSYAVLEAGNYIKEGTIIDAGVQIGVGCIIDNGTIIPHDNTIGNFVHIAPGVVLGSNIFIGDHVIVGIGASIATGVKIGRGCIISVGSSVTRDIPDYSVVEGVPGRIIGNTT